MARGTAKRKQDYLKNRKVRLTYYKKSRAGYLSTLFGSSVTTFLMFKMNLYALTHGWGWGITLLLVALILGSLFGVLKYHLLILGSQPQTTSPPVKQRPF